MIKNNNSKKSICMPVYSFYPFDPRVRRAAEALIEAGHSVDVICLKEKGDSMTDSYNGVGIHRVSLTHKRGGYLRYFYHYTMFFFQVFLALNSLDRKKKFDVVHVHSLPDFLVFVAFIQKLKGKKIILDLHEVMPEIYAARFNKKMNSPIVKVVCFFEKISTGFADHVITVNDVRAEVLRHRGVLNEKITVIMNVPDENMYIKKDLEDFKENLHLQNKFITVFVGGINYERNLEVILKAMAWVKNDIPNIYFVIFGHTYGQKGQTYINELKNLTNSLGISENVYFGGQLPGEEVKSYIELAHFGIVSYVKNPMTELAMPNKVFEYTAAGKPMISCRLKGLYSLLGDKASIYYEPENHEDLADKMIWLYNHRSEIGILVENAHKIYEMHSWDVMRERLQNVYNNL